MSMVQIKCLCKSFSAVKAVDHVELSVENGEMLCLLGPSGCGKTTLLRLLSGFLEADKGEIIMDGQNVTHLPPEKRPTSLVFQNYALFPHLDVYENVAFGLRVQKKNSRHIEEQVMKMLELVGLTGKERRAILQLSGGQQQRVALARALIMQPKVLLLDEPLSNLDAKLRVETRQHIRQIQKNVGITSIFVTHDQEEALSMADRIAIMRNGAIEQLDTPRNIYGSPANYFVADFIGKSNFLYGKIHGDTMTLSGETTIKLTNNHAGEEGDKILAIRPECVFIVPVGTAIPDGSNSLAGKIDDVVFLGESTSYVVKLEGGQKMQVSSVGHSRQYNDGDVVTVHWDQGAGNLL